MMSLDYTFPPLVPNKKPEDTTVVVAMSGGVDSSAVAALCHKAGYNTIGVTLQLWDYTPAQSEAVSSGSTKKFGTCCALDDVYDARRVCQTMGIPHYVLNLESAFKEAVIDDFVETYQSGATPIPCVRCNQRIKFDNLLHKAKALGADVLVTGHYVKKEWPNGFDAAPVIQTAQDLSKDQTYYLFTTTPEQLDFINFPLGHVDSKAVTRELAKELGLHLYAKKDSQDICFVPEGDYRKVIKKFAPDAHKPGIIRHVDGSVIGEHEGIIGYTIGQRKGLGGGTSEPLYVIKVNPEDNEIIAGPKSALGRTEFAVKELNWLAKPLEESTPLPVVAKVRAQHAGAKGTITPLPDGRAKITLAEPDPQIAPGQAAVFYTDEGYLLGGGWIEREKISVKIA